jgi:PHD/YefM family antitoxin component YafN of YafNO toxin-antitoxin module
MTPLQLLSAQKIISTRQFQSQFAAMVKRAAKDKNYYSVVRNGNSVGVFVPQQMWESLIEDMEALSSPRYLADIAEAREQIKRGEILDIDEVFDV